MNKEDKYKYYLVWFVHTILLVRNRAKNIKVDIVKMVDSIEFFEEYPWGKESFDLTLEYPKKKIDFVRLKETYLERNGELYALYRFSWTFLANIHNHLIN